MPNLPGMPQDVLPLSRRCESLDGGMCGPCASCHPTQPGYENRHICPVRRALRFPDFRSVGAPVLALLTVYSRFLCTYRPGDRNLSLASSGVKAVLFGCAADSFRGAAFRAGSMFRSCRRRLSFLSNSSFRSSSSPFFTMPTHVPSSAIA